MPAPDSSCCQKPLWSSKSTGGAARRRTGLRSSEVMMRFFNPDSRVMCALSRLADLMLLNLAVLVCSLPVLTIGASAAALFAAVRDLINERGGSILRAYFVHWRREARRATLLFLPFLLPFAVILFDLLLLYQHPRPRCSTGGCWRRPQWRSSACIWEAFRCSPTLTIPSAGRGSTGRSFLSPGFRICCSPWRCCCSPLCFFSCRRIRSFVFFLCFFFWAYRAPFLCCN